MTDNNKRLARNRDSLKDADKHAELWVEDELAFLFEMWGDEPIEDIAAALGRTIEACREKYYKTSREGLSLGHQQGKRGDSGYRGWTEADGDGW